MQILACCFYLSCFATDSFNQRLQKNASKYGYLRRPFAWSAHRLFKQSEGQALQLVEGCRRLPPPLPSSCVSARFVNQPISGQVILNQFWPISNDAFKPFDLYSAIKSKFPLEELKPDAAALSSALETVVIEGTMAFTVREWGSFCEKNIRSPERNPAMSVALFDTTRSGVSHSDPTVSVSDSTHVVEVRGGGGLLHIRTAHAI